MNGHDIKELVTTLRNMRNLKGPQLLHVVTKKGKGYDPAEKDPIKWHGPGPFDPVSGTIFKEKATGPTYSQVFGQWLCDMAARDPRIVGITPAMREGSGMVEYSKKFPQRYFDVAIAEQHAVTFAAGLACEGLRPVVAIYSTFLQRAYDQLIHDVALQNLPVVFALDRAGLVGGDGATHQGRYDYSFLRCIPNLTVMAPADENECRQMLYTATTIDGPVAVRYPRGQGPGVAPVAEMTALPVGKAQIRRKGSSGLLILAFGALVKSAEIIGERLDATVVNMRFIKPLDEELVLRLAGTHTAPGDDRRKRGRRRRRLRGHRAARQLRGGAAHAHAGHPRSLHRTRLARGMPGAGGAGSGEPRSRGETLVGTSAGLEDEGVRDIKRRNRRAGCPIPAPLSPPRG